MFTETDQQLINKALKGKKKAWFALIKRYEKPVYNYCVRMTGNLDDAKDLMQDVFIGVFNSLESYQGKSSFKSWLYKIAHYKCMDFFRRKRPEVSIEGQINEESFKNSEKDEGLNAYIGNFTAGSNLQACPEATLGQAQANQHMLNLMQKLPFKHRLVVELKFFSQFTFEEISQQLDISSNTAKSRLYAALNMLKSELESSSPSQQFGVEHG